MADEFWGFDPPSSALDVKKGDITPNNTKDGRLSSWCLASLDASARKCNFQSVDSVWDGRPVPRMKSGHTKNDFWGFNPDLSRSMSPTFQMSKTEREDVIEEPSQSRAEDMEGLEDTKNDFWGFDADLSRSMSPTFQMSKTEKENVIEEPSQSRAEDREGVGDQIKILGGGDLPKETTNGNIHDRDKMADQENFHNQPMDDLTNELTSLKLRQAASG